MVTSMTRAEYEAKYGVAPESSDVSNLEPLKMTRAEYESKYNQTTEEAPSYFQRVYVQYEQAGKDIISGVQKSAEQIAGGDVLGGATRAALRTVGGVAGAAFAPILEAPVIKPLLEGITENALKIPQVKSVVSRAMDLARQYPEYATDLKNIVDIAALVTGNKVETPVLAETGAVVGDISKVAKVLLTPSEEALQGKIVSLFEKSIKPTAKKTLGQATKYENDVLNALKTIKSNVDNLNIEDATGELVSGRAPQTINELAQGLDQTKKLVFNQYDELAKRAGTKGALIDIKPVASEVLKVSENKALQLTSPKVAQYAEDWAMRLNKLGALDTETTQEVIRLMNNNLQAFYKNPTYESASTVTIDAGIANNLRRALDEAIEGATGEQYQILKNQYSALKAIENDVVRASLRDAKKNVKGLLDYTDILTNGQMISGILSLNPAMFTKGAIERGLKEYIAYLNNPNRAISNIFDKLDINTSFKPEFNSVIGKALMNP